MMLSSTVQILEYEKLPKQPPAFLRYVRQSEDILQYYQRRPTQEALSQTSAEICRLPFPRNEIADILLRQNELLGISDPMRRAAANLAKPNSIAVMTGQQVGLFTGPVFTIYKALTALRLSEELCRRGFNAVAIFWMASDDHDLMEILHLPAAPQGSGDRAPDVRKRLFGISELPPWPVGPIRMPATIQEVINEYCESLAEPRREGFRSELAAAYRPGATFAEAFGRLLSGLFRERGLLVFDPRDGNAKRLASPVIRMALEAAPMLRSRLSERSRALQEIGLEPQIAILPRATMVFREEGGERRLLLTGDHGFLLKDTPRQYGAEELCDLTESEPERFSPNVLLRPLVQDHLFPTVAYVGGPAEVAYFAQIDPLYRFYQRPAPVIWPRAGFTILDTEASESLERHALNLEDCFQGKNHVVRKILLAEPGRAEVLLAGMRQRIEQEFEEMKPALTSMDISLGASAETIRRKLLHRVASLQSKFVNFEMRRNASLDQEVSHLLDCCYPNGNLQERELGVHSLLARHGLSLLNTLYECIDPAILAHRIVRMP
jgi:bacillithiol biosynthesis cysteine-adding enzyme BshC